LGTATAKVFLSVDVQALGGKRRFKAKDLTKSYWQRWAHERAHLINRRHRQTEGSKGVNERLENAGC
jgi:hypothetical protein